jgi:hypothetical protein
MPNDWKLGNRKNNRLEGYFFIRGYPKTNVFKKSDLNK